MIGSTVDRCSVVFAFLKATLFPIRLRPEHFAIFDKLQFFLNFFSIPILMKYKNRGTGRVSCGTEL